MGDLDKLLSMIYQSRLGSEQNKASVNLWQVRAAQRTCLIMVQQYKNQHQILSRVI